MRRELELLPILSLHFSVEGNHDEVQRFLKFVNATHFSTLAYSGFRAVCIRGTRLLNLRVEPVNSA